MKRIIALIVMFAVIFSLIGCFPQTTVKFNIDFIVDGEVYDTVKTDKSSIEMPADPKKDDCEFDGWFWDKDIWEKPLTLNSLMDAPLSETWRVYAKFISKENPIGEICSICNEEPCTCVSSLSESGQGCANCNIIPPYESRHNENKEEGVFWELPYLRAGVSALPAVDINRQPLNWGQYDSWSPQLFVINSYDDLSLMRLGRINSSRPIVHNYSEKYFENNALLFAQVTTSSGGYVPYVRFETLVTDTEALYPIFRLELPEGDGDWTCDIGSIMFLIEVPQVLLEKYELGNIGWLKNSGVAVWMGEQIQEGQINRLPNVKKIDCDCLFGLNPGEDDSVWVEYNYIFQAEGENYRFIGNSGNDSHTVYIRYDDEGEFIFAAWEHVYPPNSTNWNSRLMDLPLKVGNNQLMIVSGTTKFINGVDERTYGYASVFLSDEINMQSYEYNVSGTAGNQSFSWQSASLHKVYIRRAGTEGYESIFDGFPVAGSLRANWATRNVEIETFDFQLGINTVMIVNYTYSDGVVKRNEAKWDIERIADTVVDYNFRIGNVAVNGQSILWNGNGFYHPYIKQAGENEFVSVKGWGIKSDSGVALSQIYCNKGLNEIKVTQMQFNNGKLSLQVGLFSFNYEKVDISNQVNFTVKEQRLTWDKPSTWDYAHVFIKYPDRGEFSFADIAHNEFDLVWLRTGCNTVKVTYDWEYSGSTITEYSAYWSIDWSK